MLREFRKVREENTFWTKERLEKKKHPTDHRAKDNKSADRPRGDKIIKPLIDHRQIRAYQL